MPLLCAVVCTDFVNMLIPMEVVGVRIEMPSNQPIVLLKEISGSRFLPIWVGAVEATAIAFAQQGVEPPRPLTHDLVKTLLETVGTSLEQVIVSKVSDGIFFADLILHSASGTVYRVSARPSDAIAIALRTQSSIFASEEVLDDAGIEIPSTEGASDSSESNEEVERFREFLDQINPEDFVS